MSAIVVRMTAEVRASRARWLLAGAVLVALAGCQGQAPAVDPPTGGGPSVATSTPASPTRAATDQPGPAADPVIVAAGDISLRTPTGGNLATSDVALAAHPTAVLALGDDQYPNGTLSDFRAYYAATWGRFRDITHPVPGNHEYAADTKATGYFTYFGPESTPQAPTCASACQGYYSYDVGSWHLIALNSNDDCTDLACDASSAQVAWLERDLAATAQPCVLAYWHHPRWSSGTEHGSDPRMGALWDTLYRGGKDAADVVLNGHEHDYERFAPQDPAGKATPDGIREFVVGTGGAEAYPFGAPLATSEARTTGVDGVLQLTLHPHGYDWRFLPVAGGSFTDRGSASCH